MNFKYFVLKIRACYHFDDIIKFKDFGLYNFNRWKKTQKYFDLQHFVQNFDWARFNQEDGFITVYDGSRYLVLFGLKKYNGIYNKV